MDSINNTTKRWREIRKAYKLSQPQFAEILQTTQAAVSLIESGKTKNPSIETINRLFKAFPDLSRSWFFDGQGPMIIPRTKNLVEEILDSAKNIELPENYRNDPMLSEYVSKVRTLVAAQKDRIERLEMEVSRLENDKSFLQSLLMKNGEPIGT